MVASSPGLPRIDETPLRTSGESEGLGGEPGQDAESHDGEKDAPAARPSFDSLDLPVPYTDLGQREESTSAFALVRALNRHSEEPKRPSVFPPIASRYRLTREIGSGGTAVVYEGMHVTLERPVAVKVLVASATSRQAERLRREAKALTKLRHPSIIEVLDLDETDDGRPYMVMELLKGIDLHSRIHAGKIPPPLAIELGLQLCQALSAAHALGVVHRDLKPANVFLERTADSLERLKLLDFGMAQVDGVSKLSVEGTVVGTPTYLAPEQILQKAIDERTDVYGACLVLYEMLTGVQPFGKADKLDVLVSQILGFVPPKPSEAGAPTTLLDDVLMRGIAKRPEDRFKSAQELGAALEAVGWQIRAKAAQVEFVPSKPRVRAIEVPLPRAPTAPSPRASFPPPPAQKSKAIDRNLLMVLLAAAFAAGAFLGLAVTLVK